MKKIILFLIFGIIFVSFVNAGNVIYDEFDGDNVNLTLWDDYNGNLLTECITYNYTTSNGLLRINITATNVASACSFGIENSFNKTILNLKSLNISGIYMNTSLGPSCGGGPYSRAYIQYGGIELKLLTKTTEGSLNWSGDINIIFNQDNISQLNYTLDNWATSTLAGFKKSGLELFVNGHSTCAGAGSNATMYIDNITYIGDLNPPYFSNNKTNFSFLYQNENGQFNITITDESNIDTIIFAIKNDTSDWENITTQRILLNNETTTNKTVTFNFTISTISGKIQYWKFYANDSYGQMNESETYQTTIKFPSLNNCTEGDIVLTMNIYDEEATTTPLEADVEINMEYWLLSPDNTQNFSQQLNGSNKYNICLSENVTIYSDVYIKYTTINGFTHRYYLFNQSLTNTTLNISMYNFDTQTGISDLRGTVRDKSTYNYFENVIAKLQRRYVAENVWRTVQMDRSGDFGLVFFNIKEENTDYRVIFTDTSNNILKTTDSMKFSCDSSLCELTFLLDAFAVIAAPTDLGVSYTYDNSTGDLILVWDDPIAGTTSVRILVTKEGAGGAITICETTQSGASGTFTCNTHPFTGQILLRVYRTASPEIPFFSDWLVSSSVSLGDLLDNNLEGAFWTVGMIITIVGFGLFSPVAAIIALIVSLILTFFLGMFTPLTLTFLILSIIIAIVLGLKVNQ